MLPHRKHYNYQTKQRRLTYWQICTSAWKNFSTDPWTWTGHLWEKTLKYENPASPCSLHLLLETKKCLPLWASWIENDCAMLFALCRHRQRSPHWFCGLGWSYQLPGSHLPTPEKVISSQAWKCLLLRNGGTEILEIQRRKRQRLIWKVLFSLLPQGISEQQSWGVNGIISSSEGGIRKDRSQLHF